MTTVTIPQSVWANMLFDIATLQAKVKVRDELLEQADGAIALATAALEWNTRKMQADAQRIKELESALEQKEGDFSGVQKLMMEQSSTITRLQSRLEGYVAPDHMREIEADYEKLVDRLDQRIAELESEREGWSSECMRVQRQRDALRDLINRLNMEVEALDLLS